MDQEEYISTVFVKAALKVRIKETETGGKVIDEVLDIIQIDEFKER